MLGIRCLAASPPSTTLRAIMYVSTSRCIAAVSSLLVRAPEVLLCLGAVGDAGCLMLVWNCRKCCFAEASWRYLRKDGAGKQVSRKNDS